MKEDSKETKQKPPEHFFSESDQMFENSVRHKNYWIDSFFLCALIWAFGSLLNEQGRREFNTWLLKALDDKD